MPTKSALQFRQREDQYIEIEDGLNFKGWYHVDDIKRIIWKKFSQLSDVFKKDILQPYVFFDGLDQFSLKEMLNPLIIKLKMSSKKYFPFIFKPELASAHYISGFLRKNTDKTVSVILFNPTGTAPRVNYDDYVYQFRLMPAENYELNSAEMTVENENSEELMIHSSEDELINFSDDEFNTEMELEKDTLYFTIENKALQYTVINPFGDKITALFSEQDLNDLGIFIDFQKALTLNIIQEQLIPKKIEILKKTLARGHTEKKIEIISSFHKIQTSQRDRGVLVSCGPLSLAFIEYIIDNPHYMAYLDNTFQLPKFLKLALSTDVLYKQLVMKLRQRHYQILDSIEDSVLDSDCIDDSYGEMTQHILAPELQSREQKPEKLLNEFLSAEFFPEARDDVKFVRNQIKRFRDNGKCFISFNNSMKADAIEHALNEALKEGIGDVRKDERVKDALAIHRIFSFFGYKSTRAIIQLQESLSHSYPVK